MRCKCLKATSSHGMTMAVFEDKIAVRNKRRESGRDTYSGSGWHASNMRDDLKGRRYLPRSQHCGKPWQCVRSKTIGKWLPVILSMPCIYLEANQPRTLSARML